MLYEIVENLDSIIKLFNSIFEEISIDEIFNNDFDKIIGQDRYTAGFDIVEELKKKGLEATKWYTGLKAACKDDRNIINISSPNNIPSWKNGGVHDSNKDKRYNYPRFKTISQIYSFLSDLGPHIDEANIVDGVVDVEYATEADAFGD